MLGANIAAASITK